MNNIVLGGIPQTMSSREIAELTGKEHKNVTRDIRSMLDELGKDGSDLSHVREDKDIRGYTSAFHLDRELTDTLLTGYSATLRRAVIRRWQELENSASQPDPLAALNDPATMRGLLLTYSEKMIELQQANAELAPKADALDRIATADGSMNITASAKALQMQPKALFTYLQAHSWIYRRNGGKGYLGYQAKVVTGVLEHKVTTILRGDGSEKIVEQVLITAKGLAKLAAILPRATRAA